MAGEDGEGTQSLMCRPHGCAGERGAVKGEALCARAEARPWTALTPAPGNGHTHEAQAMGDARKRVTVEPLLLVEF